MKLTVRVPVTAGLMALLLLSATGCRRLRANDQINKGVADFKNARFESATNHFQNAVDIDPDNPNPLIYLATTYSSQVVPGLDSADNKKVAQKALDTFHKVLDRDPTNVIALKQIALIDREVGNLDEAKQYQIKVLQIDPNDAETLTSMGASAFYAAYKNSEGAIKGEGLVDKGDGNPKLSKASCVRLQGLNTTIVNDGMVSLQKAIAIDPTNDSAMTYMSLLSLQKADIECGNADAIKTDLAAHEMWTNKAMGARAEVERKKEEKLHGVSQ